MTEVEKAKRVAELLKKVKEENPDLSAEELRVQQEMIMRDHLVHAALDPCAECRYKQAENHKWHYESNRSAGAQ
jgi:hypothetical protein